MWEQCGMWKEAGSRWKGSCKPNAFVVGINPIRHFKKLIVSYRVLTMFQQLIALLVKGAEKMYLQKGRMQLPAP